MADDVVDQGSGTEQTSEQLPDSGAVENTEVAGAPGASENQEAETEDQKNERVQKEAAVAAEKRSAKRQSSLNARFSELTTKATVAETRANELAAQNARLLEAVLAGKGVGVTTSTEGEPKPEAFTDYNDYVRALARYEAKQVSKAEVAETTKVTNEASQREAQARSQREIDAQYVNRARVAAKSIPDFDEVMADSAHVDVPPHVVALVKKMPDGPMLAYHMAKNPELIDQFYTQPPEMHGILLGQISATIKGPAKVSNAPPPGKGVQSKPGTGSAAPSDPDQYMIWRAKNLR